MCKEESQPQVLPSHGYSTLTSLLLAWPASWL